MKNILYTATYYQKIYIYTELDGKKIYIQRKKYFLEIGYREKLRLDICTEWSNYKKYLYRKKISSGNDLKIYNIYQKNQIPKGRGGKIPYEYTATNKKIVKIA